MKSEHRRSVTLLVFLVGWSLLSCQRETPAGKSTAPQPVSAVDRAAQQAVDAIKTPMDKARGVEGTVNDAADRTTERVREGTQ